MTFSSWLKILTMSSSLLAVDAALSGIYAQTEPQNTNAQKAAARTRVAQNIRPRITVQGANQSNYSRVVLDVPEDTAYRVEKTGNRLRVIITGRFRTDLSKIRGQDLTRIGNATTSRAGLDTIISFDVVSGVSPRDFRSGQFVILDVYGGDEGAVLPIRSFRRNTIAPSRNTATATPTPSTAPNIGAANTAQAANASGADVTGGTVTGDTVTDAASSADNADTPSAADSPAGTEAAETSTDTGDSADSAGSNPADEPQNTVVAVDTGGNTPTGTADTLQDNASSDDDPEPIIELPKPVVVQPAQALPASTGRSVIDVAALARTKNPDLILEGFDVVSPDDTVVTAVVAEVDNGISMNFAIGEPVASAVFERGGMLWIVFDQPYKFDPTGLAEAGQLFTGRVRQVEQREHPDALVLRMAIRANQSTVVERDQNNWIVYLKDTPAKPRFPLKPVRREEAGKGQQIFVSATDIGRKIEIEDPDVGDQIVIVPMGRQGHGLAESYSYATAELLESAQGVIVTPLTDFVDVERYRDGISIRSTGNDILSASRLSRATGIGDDVHTGFSRLIDFANWRIGESWEYRKNKARLFYELSLRPSNSRNDVRWKLARYYLAHGRAGECLGILERILAEDPLLAQNSEFLAVRGVANFKQGRLADALKDLGARELEAEQDADLWRTLVQEALGENEKALEHYRRGRDVMGTYDIKDRAEIQLAVVRSAIATGNLELAQQELDLLNGQEVTETQLAESLYQGARIAEQQGQLDEAFAQYDDLSNARQRWIAARARYSRINFGVNNGDLTALDAIEQLERLRYAWRGDLFEVQLLDDLSEFYFETGQYEEGLRSLREGVSYYPEAAKERRMLLRMNQVFRTLFLDGGADRMAPISAIALFEKFKDLTPLGSDGDLLIRRLAARLVSVDLLGNAAEMLKYQVEFRTEGAARAQIAASLAKIYIMDDKPEAALEIMRATREPRLPADIESNRRHVEARASRAVKIRRS
ncbi:MAG: hypothetical protein JKY57_03505 [Kordiimonadaceae bacterium]|nr:hypothetical protein [Kordiimonadaceae bacterium]